MAASTLSCLATLSSPASPCAAASPRRRVGAAMASEPILIQSIEDLQAVIGNCAGRATMIVIRGLTRFRDPATVLRRLLYEKRRDLGWTVEDADLNATDRCLSMMVLCRSFSSVMFQIESWNLLDLHVLSKLRRELSKVSGLWDLVGVDDAMAIAMEGQSILREFGLSDGKPLDADIDAMIEGDEEATDDDDSPSDEDNNMQDEQASVSRPLTLEEAVLKNRISALKVLIQKMVDGPIRFP